MSDDQGEWGHGAIVSATTDKPERRPAVAQDAPLVLRDPQAVAGELTDALAQGDGWKQARRVGDALVLDATHGYRHHGCGNRLVTTCVSEGMWQGRGLAVLVLLVSLAAGCGDQGEASRLAAPASASAARVSQVTLTHCGVANIQHDGLEWEVENAPFDGGSAPDPTFSGYGTFRRDGGALTFMDEQGAVLNFTPWDGTPDPYNCG